jgi:hypothetical protein
VLDGSGRCAVFGIKGVAREPQYFIYLGKTTQRGTRFCFWVYYRTIVPRKPLVSRCCVCRLGSASPGMTPETSTQRAHTEGRSPAEVVSGDDGNGCPGNNSSASVFEEAIRVEKPPAPFEALETAAASRGLGALTTGTSTETPSTAPTGAGRPEEHSGTASRVGALGERQSWPARGHGVPNARGVVGAGTTTAARMHTLGRGGRVVVQQPSSSAEQNAKPDVRSESADTPEATTAVAAAAMLKASRNDTGDRTAIPSTGPVVRSAQQAAWSRQRSVPDPARNATGRIFSRATQGASARSATPTSDFPALVRENPTQSKPSAMQQRNCPSLFVCRTGELVTDVHPRRWFQWYTLETKSKQKWTSGISNNCSYPRCFLSKVTRTERTGKRRWGASLDRTAASRRYWPPSQER